jgi:hypothetical protein
MTLSTSQIDLLMTRGQAASALGAWLGGGLSHRAGRAILTTLANATIAAGAAHSER